MRKCINLEDQPGFASIYAPQMQQAIDRGLAGHSGTGVVDWGYIPPGGTKPVRPINPPKVDKVELPDYKNGKHYNVKNAVKLGGDDYFDYLFNINGTPEMRALINKFPPIPITAETTVEDGIVGRGYYADYEGEYGTVHTPKGGDHDIGTLFHEYGHALDHMMGIKTGLNDSQLTTLGYSTLVMPQFIEDGVDLGIVFDDSAYWEYIEANGIDTTFNGRTVFKIAKGTDRQQTEEKMNMGDHWRVMEYLLGKVKTDLQNANNAKNPDPVKIKRAEEMKARIEKLYDAHINRIKVVKDIVIQLEDSLQPGRNAELYYQIYSVHDIIDGLSMNEIFDYQVATKDDVLSAGHFPGYFSMRKQGRKVGHQGPPRNFNLKGAQAATRVETFAQFYQFYNYPDKKTYKLLAKLMPKSAKQFEKIMKEAYNIKV